MKRVVVVSALVAAAAGLSALSRRPPDSPVFRAPGAVSGAKSRHASLCPPGTLPDQGVCIPVPRAREIAALRASESIIPRRPDRPADYARYSLPVAASGGPKVVALDPQAAGDAGAPRAGISIAATAATPVLAPTLEGQQGPTEVVFVGTLVGNTTITRHTARTGDRKNDYVLILGNLAATNALAPRTNLSGSDAVGKVGASPLYLECRMLRPGVDPFAIPGERMFDEAVAVPVDPRNVLPLRN